MNTYKSIFLFGFLIVFIFFSNTNIGSSNDELEKVEKILPKMMNQSFLGTKFVFGFHPCWEDLSDDPENNSNSFKVYVYSTFQTNVRLTIPFVSSEPYIQKTINANEITEFIIPSNIGQPYQRGANAKRNTLLPTQVWSGRGILLESDMPIVAYGFARFFNTSDGFAAIPVQFMGKEYVVSSFRETTYFTYQSLTPYVSVIAPYDNTNVSFFLGGNSDTKIKTDDGKTWRSFEMLKSNLNRGDYWLIAAEGPFSDLGGSLIVSDKPISVLSGNHCGQVPFDVSACDYMIEQEVPTEFWGKKYYIPPVYSRRKASIIRLYANESNTVFKQNGLEFWISKSKWGQENEDWLEMRANADSNMPVVIHSNKAINVMQFNTGQDDDGMPGDPFQMSIISEDQFQNELVYFTPGINKGLGFDNNYLNIVFTTDDNESIPDDLEIGEIVNVNDVLQWNKVKDLEIISLGKFQDPLYANLGKKAYFTTIKVRSDIAQKIRCSSSKIAAYSYGFSNYDSYGFPASLSLRDINKKDTLPPRPVYAINCSGSLYNPNDNSSILLLEDKPTNNASGLSFVFFDKSKSYNYDFKYKDFIPGDTKSTTWSLNIQNPNKDAKAIITFTDRAGNDTTITIIYKSIKLSLNPDRFFFGNLLIGEEKTQKFTLKNESLLDPVHLKEISLLTNKQAQASQGFTLDFDFNPDYLLQPQEEIDLFITFKATKKGEFKDSIGIGDTCFYNYIGYIFASVEMPYVYTSDIDFKQRAIGKKYAQNGFIKNYGNSPIEIKGIIAPKSFEFTYDQFPFDSQNPLTLNKGEEYQFEIYFEPQKAGKYLDTLTFYFDRQPDDDPYCILKGEGIEPFLDAEDAFWQKQIAHLSRFDAIPVYNFTPYPNAKGGIIITNKGSKEINLSKIRILEETNADAFEILINGEYRPLKNYVDSVDLIRDINNLLITKIEGEASRIIPLFFHPRTAGNHKIIAEFVCDAISNPISNIYGVGSYGILDANNIDFTTQVIGGVPQTKQVTIKNRDDWEYKDTITIWDILSKVPEEISENLNNFGTKGFAFDKSSINFPIKIAPGDSLTFDVSFTPLQTGDILAKLITVSNALEEEEIQLIAYGVNQMIEVKQPEIPMICKSTPINTNTLFVINHSLIDIEIVGGSLKFLENPSNFEVVSATDSKNNNVNLNQNFIIPSLDTFFVKYNYVPISTNEFNKIENITDSLEIRTNSQQIDLQNIHSAIKINQIQYLRETYSTINSSDYFKIIPSEKMISDSISYKLFIKSGTFLEYVNADTLIITIEYEKNFLALFKNNEQPKIRIGDGLPISWNIISYSVNLNQNTNIEKLQIVLAGDEPIKTDNSLGLLQLNFYPFYPYYRNDNNQLMIKASKVEIKHTIEPNDKCVTFQSERSTYAELAETCVDELRNVIINDFDYGITSINPNPIDINSAFSFSVPFNQFVNIELFDVSGKKIITLLNSKLQPGNYTLRLPYEKIENGAFFINFDAGEYKNTISFIK